jgi:hypothetical protein
MHSDQYPYRELHDRILGSGSSCEFRILVRWLREHPGESEWLRSFRARGGPNVLASPEELWRLYALSRVVDLITLSFQQGTADRSSWPGPGLSVADLSTFAEALGMSVVFPRRFSPFDCEIVGAANTGALNDPIIITKVHWPCLMLGNLLIARAGVSIEGGARWFVATTAVSSTLYWAYRRKTRPHQDLSHGWGSNSQWRTSFRRDYRVAGSLYFNIDGRHDLAARDLVSVHEDSLTQHERIELLTNRCFVITAKEGDDLWPYDDKLRVDDA